MSITDTIHAAAVILAERERLRATGARLPPACRPADFETAFAIQAETLRLLGKRIGGWKCGTPSPGKVVAAPVHADDIHIEPGCGGYAQAGKLRIEPELAFILARPLPPRSAPYAPAEVDAAIGGAHLALELIGGRYASPDDVPFVEHLADRLHNRAMYIGPRVAHVAGVNLGAIPLTVISGDTEMRAGGIHPDGNPLLPLYWLAEFLRERGIGLKEGDTVITGSYLPSFEISAGKELSVQFGEFGTLRAHFDC